ncbi:MAG: bifunctional aspartate carbamoyltransferase catalytic subunit/aspartate carbamoyltransferase regulatory subunit, partial [Spirochaetaceae bacterium]|nr:bifunctional aspartate carbamoyltransferase catalytic subunit/aspartate carbamoyltransferase regulatory subunit [Spirochaetaceae bacterium]
LTMPPKIYKFSEISCKNSDCVTYPDAFQHVSPYFFRSEGETFTCRYCGKRHAYGDIWNS